ncbi:MAG TPA: DivIVA domain-containing protein [Candidatus Acidoferrum sp.]|jgi:cell division initiation protein|nr:DivIVA domain-containing protein [Candidatus Acidoferrum sp.]
MRISPHDIRQQQFTTRMFRGFEPHEVDAFLQDVADEYETLLKEFQSLKEQLAAQDERQRGVLELERTLQDTLLTTQRLVDEMKTSARRDADEIRSAARHEADLIVREAELRGEKAVESARTEEARIRVDIQALKRIRRQLVEDLGATLERYQRLLGSEGHEGGEPE